MVERSALNEEICQKGAAKSDQVSFVVYEYMNQHKIKNREEQVRDDDVDEPFLVELAYRFISKRFVDIVVDEHKTAHKDEGRHSKGRQCIEHLVKEEGRGYAVQFGYRFAGSVDKHHRYNREGAHDE